MRFEIVGRTIQQYGTKLGLQNDNDIESVEFLFPSDTPVSELLKEGIPYLVFFTSSKRDGYMKLDKKEENGRLILTWLVGSQITEDVGLIQAQIRISGLEKKLWQSEITTFEVCRSLSVETPQPVVYTRSSRGLTANPSLKMANPNTEPPITVTERKMNIPPVLQNIAVQNDENSETVRIIVPRHFDGNDLSQYSFYLRTSNSGGYDPIPLQPVVAEDELTIQWTLKPPQTSYPGRLSIQLWVTGKDFSWHSEAASMNILTEIDGEPIIPVTPSILDDFIKQVSIIANNAKESEKSAAESASNAAASANNATSEADRAEAEANRAADIAVKTPYVGEDGYWYVWSLDSGEYLKTDVMADGNTMFATFGIEPETGILSVTTPDEYKGAEFVLHNDYLEVKV